MDIFKFINGYSTVANGRNQVHSVFWAGLFLFCLALNASPSFVSALTNPPKLVKDIHPGITGRCCGQINDVSGTLFFTSADSGSPWIGEYQVNVEFDPAFDPHVVIEDNLNPDVRALYVADPGTALSAPMVFSSVI